MRYMSAEKETVAEIWLLRSKTGLGFALTAAVLAGAAILWIVAAFGWFDLSDQARMEKRTMQATGSTTLPHGQLKLVIQNDSACLHIDEAFAHGTKIHLYAKNDCSKQLNLPNYAYSVLTADSTTIESNQWAFNGNMRIQAGERREQEFEIKNDSRAVSVSVRGIDGQ